MFNAVAFGAGGVAFLALGAWFVWRQRRRHAGTLAGWGALALGAAQLIHAAGSLTSNRQPLSLVLATCCAVVSVVGYILVASGRDTVPDGRGRSRRKRRKLPPIRP
jgi:drug/metabolite transporter (DMT)-like permease